MHTYTSRGAGAVVVLTAVIVVGLGCASAKALDPNDPNSRGVFPISTADGEPSDPAISGDTVVWQDNRDPNTSSDIYGRDLLTGTEFPICTANGRQYDPAISGDIVVWQDVRDPNGAQLYGYRLSTGTEFLISSDSGGSFAVSGDIVVRSEYIDPNTGSGIYGYRLSTGAKFPICTVAGSQERPAISGDVVVWEDLRDPNTISDYDIYGYRLSTGAEFPICTVAGCQKSAAISGDIVVWLDSRAGAERIYGYSLSTGTEFPVETAYRAMDPAISGDIVVWLDPRPYPYSGVSAFDLSTQSEFRVVMSGHHPAVGGGIVVWAGNGNGDNIFGAKPAAWTVMVYMAADNEMEAQAIDDLLEMAQVKNPNVNIIVQLDRGAGGDARFGDWTTTKRFCVVQGMTPSADNQVRDLGAEPEGDIGEANMGYRDTLWDFVQWARERYPARRHALIVWDHGGGLEISDRCNPVFRGICDDHDDGAGGTDALSMWELRSAISLATSYGVSDPWPLDVVAVDACLTGGLEMAYEVKDCAGFYVGSAELMPADGFEYQNILDPVSLNGNTTPQEWTERIVEAYQEDYDNLDDRYTLMGVRLDLIDQVANQVSDLALLFIGRFGNELGNILAARASSRLYSDDDTFQTEAVYQYFVDLYDFCWNMRELTADEDIDAQCQLVMDTIDHAVQDHLLINYWGDDGYAGTGAHQRCFSLYYPPSRTGQYADDFLKYDGNYLSFLEPVDQYWDDFLRLSFQEYRTLTLGINGAEDDAVDVEPNSPNLPPYLFLYGTEVTLTAQPGEDRAFSQWAILDPCHPGDLNYATTDSNNPLMLTMDENWEVQAVFKCGSQAAMGMPAMVLVLAVFGFASRRWRSRRRA